MQVTNQHDPQGVPAVPARNNKALKWVLGAVAVLVMGLLGLLLMGAMATNIGIVPLLIGAVLATLPVPIYLTLALWVDRFEKEPIWMLAGAFIWGATIAVFFSYVFNSVNGMLVSSFFGSTAGEIFGTVVSAPLVEEGSKGLALFILYFWKKDEFDGVIDGIVYAAMVGLGFAMVENFQYYGVALLSGGVAGSAFSFVLRGMLSPFAHPLFTSLTGIGLGLARQSNKSYVKFIAPIAGLLAAMLLHGTWNLSSTLGGIVGFFGTYLIIMVPAFIGLLAIVSFALRREGRVVSQYLTPELQSGLLSQQEYDSLGSVRGRMGSSMQALRGGFGSWRAHSRFAQTATELAFHRDRVQRGITSVDTAAREAAYVQALQGMRGQQAV